MSAKELTVNLFGMNPSMVIAFPRHLFFTMYILYHQATEK